MRVREYAERDRLQVLALAPRMREGMAPWRDPEAILVAVIDWVRTSIDSVGDVDRAIFVADDERGVLGFASVATWPHFTGEVDAYVGELVVHPRGEGQGVGAALMRQAEAWARQRGIKRLTIETPAGNVAARRLYRALGYDEEDVRLSKGL